MSKLSYHSANITNKNSLKHTNHMHFYYQYNNQVQEITWLLNPRYVALYVQMHTR